MSMDIINISEIGGKKYKVLSGVELGQKARKQFNLDLLDSQKNIVTILVPESVYSVNSSFFSGLFQKSLIQLKEKAFREQYIFECDEIIRKNIENGIFNIVNTFDFIGG